jgi:hypothetical protein
MLGIPWPWLLGAAIGLGGVALFAWIPISIELQFQVGKRNGLQSRIRLAWWTWVMDSSPSSDSDDWHAPFAEPHFPSSSQAGFLRIPWPKALSWKLDWKKWRRQVWIRIQHGLYSVATNASFWRACVKWVIHLPVRMFQCLNWRVLDMELSHAKPEVLGRMAAWNAGLGSALGAALPIRWNFEIPHFQCNGSLQIRGRIYQWARLFLRVLRDLPWIPLVVAFWQGALSPGLKGWRHSSFVWLQRILTLVEARSRTPA